MFDLFQYGLIAGGALLFLSLLLIFFDFMCAGEAVMDTIADWWDKLRGRKK